VNAFLPRLAGNERHPNRKAWISRWLTPVNQACGFRRHAPHVQQPFACHRAPLLDRGLGNAMVSDRLLKTAARTVAASPEVTLRPAISLVIKPAKGKHARVVMIDRDSISDSCSAVGGLNALTHLGAAPGRRDVRRQYSPVSTNQ
jgi:hypothetical protein